MQRLKKSQEILLRFVNSGRCSNPRFQKTLLDHHVRLLRETYLLLNRNTGRLPEDCQTKLDSSTVKLEGSTVNMRIAHIRTWTYITHRSQWLDNALYWQERTRNIEDRLSDKLHKKLAKRFIDRKAAMFHRKKIMVSFYQASIAENFG